MDGPQTTTPDRTADFPVIILTGLSGAGKTSVIKVFEDLGFFSIDGLPLEIAPQVLPLLGAQALASYRGLVLRLDLSRHGHSRNLTGELADLRGMGDNIRILFIDADNETIMRRYATTRRPHPLDKSEEDPDGIGLEQAVVLEREYLAPILNMSDMVIDTSAFSIHDLRRFVQQHFSVIYDQTPPLRVHLISFGFKYGIPAEAEMMFDLRFLPNPYFVQSLQPMSGLERDVADYVLEHEPGKGFIVRLTDFLQYLLPLYQDEGRYRVTLAFGCTGGRHRSVAVTERVSAALKKLGFAVSVEHRHLELG